MNKHSYVSITKFKEKPMNVFQTAKNCDSVIVMKRANPVGVLLSVDAYRHLQQSNMQGDKYE